MNQLDAITAALSEIGVQSPGDATPDSADLAQASKVLNRMIDGFQARKLYIFGEQRQVFVPAQLKQTYTLGTNGDFNVPRPARITRFGVLSLNNPLQPIELPLDSLTEEQWARIPVKNISSALPQRVYDDQQFPLRNLNYWPIPNVLINFIVYNWVQLNSWAIGDYKTDLTFPPAYQDLIVYNLAVRLIPSFSASAVASPVLIELARSSIRAVQAMNAKMIDLKCDPMLVSPEKQVYDWRTDTRVGNG